MKKKNSNEQDDVSIDNFFVKIPDDVFKATQKQIENYDKKSESSPEPSEDILTPEMLLQLSKKGLSNSNSKK